MQIAARVPLRISLAGGGSDIEPFAREFGSNIVSFTITQYVHADLWTNSTDKLIVDSLETGERHHSEVWDDKNLTSRLELAAALSVEEKDRAGISMAFRSPVGQGSGLGASSAIIIAMAGLMKKFAGESFSSRDLAECAFEIERKKMKILGGFQDHYACSFGGINHISMQNGTISVDKINCSRDFQLELEHNLILIDLGLPRVSHGIIEEQQTRNKMGDDSLIQILKEQSRLGLEMRDSLLNEDLEEIGKILNAGWRLKKNTARGVSTKEIDDLNEVLIKEGALATKVTGAGGGGHLLVLSQRHTRQRIMNKIRELRITPVDFAIEKKGFESWNI
jgi:D-glycero-alpha-D-manno-heptose-7-phosphate kinase